MLKAQFKKLRMANPSSRRLFLLLLKGRSRFLRRRINRNHYRLTQCQLAKLSIRAKLRSFRQDGWPTQTLRPSLLLAARTASLISSAPLSDMTLRTERRGGPGLPGRSYPREKRTIGVNTRARISVVGVISPFGCGAKW